jgi:hypothetical protein
MRLRRVLCVALLALTAVLALAATSASSSVRPQSPQAVGTASTAKVGVRYKVTKFVRRGNRLVAYGTAIARYIPESGSVTTSRKPFKATVALRGRHLASVQDICPVLDLTLGPLDLNLLGAMVHLDQVHLTITANSEGGLLGRLLCSLQKQGKIAAQTKKLNWVVKKSGLATTGTGFVVAVQPSSTSGGGSSPQAITPLTICPILDLTLGPTHLDLLGLVVDLNTVHLTITADSEGGLLGSLLCSLAGSGATG